MIGHLISLDLHLCFIAFWIHRAWKKYLDGRHFNFLMYKMGIKMMIIMTMMTPTTIMIAGFIRKDYWKD